MYLISRFLAEGGPAKEEQDSTMIKWMQWRLNVAGLDVTAFNAIA